MSERRTFDVAVLGASGATGREVVRHLAARAREHSLSWCVAGRDLDKLRHMLDAVACDVPVVEVDLDAPRALRSLVESTAVLVNAVGPYSRFGTLVPMSCAVSGTHYIDACAELDVVRDMIAECAVSAVESGARLVHTAGFLSLPFDLATSFAAHHSGHSIGSPLAEIDVAITVRTGGLVLGLSDVVSGGTLAGSAEAIRRGGNLFPDDARYLVAEPHEPLAYGISAREHRGTGHWLGPMLPAPHVNPAIVHRTASSLSSEMMAAQFRYRDGIVAAGLVPGIPDSLAATWMAGAGVFTSMVGMAPASVRNLVADTMQAVGPRVGSGPSVERLAAWSWRLDCCAQTLSGASFSFDVEGQGHLGYRSSAALLAEAALLLPGADRSGSGGVLTPAMAFGVETIARFERAGMVFSAISLAS